MSAPDLEVNRSQPEPEQRVSSSHSLLSRSVGGPVRCTGSVSTPMVAIQVRGRTPRTGNVGHLHDARGNPTARGGLTVRRGEPTCGDGGRSGPRLAAGFRPSSVRGWETGERLRRGGAGGEVVQSPGDVGGDPYEVTLGSVVSDLPGFSATRARLGAAKSRPHVHLQLRDQLGARCGHVNVALSRWVSVKGHGFLPTGGYETCPLVATGSARWWP